ncbi:MAG: ATP-binding cassette domain-containing protein [Johnsonella sp.]|nr:ATP-binding cassette domain-containing protein [Johnsonella sp.]
MSLYVDIRKKLRHFELKIFFNLEDHQGIAGILGASGCGKSMCLKCIAGIERPDSGKIILNERVLFDSEKKINLSVQERNIGYLFQNYALFPHITIRENIMMGAKRSKASEEAQEYMKLLKIEELAEAYPDKLSGGQQQRAALARMLISKPELIMMDEPFSALDSYLKEWLQLELYEIITALKKNILLVTHSREEIYRFCDRIHILEEGRLVACGATKDIFHNPKKIAAARLTGCKNILKVQRLDERSVFAEDLGTKLLFRRPVPEGITHIGVRAHDLRPAGDFDRDNIVSCMRPKLLDDPFELVIIYENGLWWKVARDFFEHEYGGKIPEKIYIPEEAVFFLNEE